MRSTLNFARIIKRISTLALLLTVIIQIVTIILMESDFEVFDIEEIHEISGFIILGLIAVHVIVFRKSLMNILTSKIQ